MKSNKALRFIVLLIAVMAFFMVYASTGDSSDNAKEEKGGFSGTYVYTFQTVGRCKFDFENGGAVIASE